MKNTLIICFCLFLCSNILFAQYQEPKKLDVDFDFGIIAEIGFLYLEKTIDSTPLESSSIREIETKNITSDSPFSFYLSGRINYSKYLGLEIRPGIIFGGDEYTGFELGILLRYKFWQDKMFAAGGVNFHFNGGSGHGTFFATDETFMFYGLNLGINLNKSFAFIASFYILPQKEFLYQEYNWDAFNYYDYTLKSVLKLGFDFTF